MSKKKPVKKKSEQVKAKRDGWPRKMWLVMKVSKWDAVKVHSMGCIFDAPTESDAIGFCRVYDDRDKAMEFAGGDESLVKQIETLA